MPPRALWLNSTSRATACFSATLHASKWYLAAALEHQPYVSARAIYELGLSPLSLSTIATLSGSHVIAGASAAMSSLGSAVAIAMMVGGGGAPPLAHLWPRCLLQTALDPRTGSGTVLFGSGLLQRWSGACPALVSRLIACRQVLRMR